MILASIKLKIDSVISSVARRSFSLHYKVVFKIGIDGIFYMVEIALLRSQ